MRLRCSVRLALSSYLFQTVLLNCVIHSFICARVFGLLLLGRDLSVRVLGLRCSVILALSHCLFQTMLLSLNRDAFIYAGVFGL